MRLLVKQLYHSLILQHAKLCIVVTLLIAACFATFIDQVRLEVSADSLVLENDKDLEFYRFANERYGSDEFLVLTYRSNAPLFSGTELNRLSSLVEKIQQVDQVESVVSILNVPLLFSPKKSLSQVTRDSRYLRHADTDLNLAINELSSSPLYGNRLLSTDQRTTAIQVNYTSDEKLNRLRESRDELRQSDQSADVKKQAEIDYRRYQNKVDEKQKNTLHEIRAALEDYRAHAEIHMGGIPMIAVDMLRFIKHDINVFGALVLMVMAALMWLAFRGIKWVILPVVCVSISTITTLGVIGLLSWPISAVSSNFIALLLIFGLSLMIHLIVHYKELADADPLASQNSLVGNMAAQKMAPSFFTILTTIIAFGSLVVSNIRPVIDFGWIMIIALLINLLISFTLFPSLLSLLKRSSSESKSDFTSRITEKFADVSLNHGKSVITLFILVSCFCAWGLSFLSVDNRFIDYFSPETEIYKGMVTIDEQLGGTTQLDILIDAPSFSSDQQDAVNREQNDSAQGGEEPALSEPDPFEGDPFADDPFADDPFADDPFAESSTDRGSLAFTDKSHWFNSARLDQIKEVHHYLDQLPDTGKVLSLSTTVESLEKLNDDKILDNFFLSIFYTNLSSQLKAQLIDPYLSKKGDQIRFTARIYESNVGLDRQGLIDQIHHDLQQQFDLAPEQIHITGMVVLYNNLLQSLFRSQILTLGAVFIAIGLTFVVIFRSVKVAILALIPNLVSALCVLGLLGIFQIALDLMTITIAAISVGIAVDDTIHYVHRFKTEWQKKQHYRSAVFSAHQSIGKAMYYTSITISIGFVVMMFSQFTPTVYFGVFTALAMLIALIANLTLLPILLSRFKAYGPELTAES